eukprot:TRINITY_DN74758_c0_g1_i1.p1 TRINITY_DN74758_c0_g1~~TRINITY_DN74758_c0_g1_i1.p1  ORF type:complete len:173 (+),score=19.22 TRINITY_DN74758_c0_g1_i1:3-521(+)
MLMAVSRTLLLGSLGPAGAHQWPDCQEQNTVIRSAGQALSTDVLGLGATGGCFLDDCTNSDKFSAADMSACWRVCLSVPGCNFWTWGIEDQSEKCWLRTGDAGRETADGWISGSKSCHPPEATVIPLGRPECFVDGIRYEQCCAPWFRPTGNLGCWKGVYNYDNCCFPALDL